MTAPDSRRGVRASVETVRALIDDCFGALGYTPQERAAIAEILLEASLAGYDSHGVMRIPTYVEDTRAGLIAPAVAPVITHETAASARLDARRCHGIVSTAEAIRIAGEKARALGIGCVGVYNGNDVARLGSHVVAPAHAGLITLLMVNDAGGGAAVAPWGGAAPFLSTNPLALGIPREAPAPPVVIDLSTSVVALGKLKMALNRGERVPEGWLVERSGQSTTDPGAFFTKPRSAALRPLGGTTDGHKGFMLSLMVELFAGALAGAGCSSGNENEDQGNGLFVLAADPAAFGNGAGCTHAFEALATGLAACPPEAGSAGVRLPGERLAHAAAARERDGLPIDGPTWAKITTIVEELGLRGDYPMTPVA